MKSPSNYRNPPLGPDSPGRAQRRDSLPEYAPWPDTGCEVSPACLACPLSRCRHDDHLAYQHSIALASYSALQALRDAGLTVKQVAARAGVSRRTVLRHTHPRS